MTPACGRPLTVDELERWVAAGAHWRPVQIGDARAIVDLCQCTGETVERREAIDAAVIEYVRDHAAERD
jgi:hypothetical protein